MSQKHRPFVPSKRPMCCGKNAYATRQEAELVADEQTLITDGLVLATYRCTCGCGSWHL